MYISYLDSVHYFRPKQKRTALYFEILLGYLEYVKQLGFVYAHIWACPPSEGDDYIFHCHPPEQRVPKPKRLQEWYKTMLEIAIQQRVVVDYKDVLKDCNESGITKASDIPYFEGDFWSSTMEDLLKELDIEEEDRRRIEELEAVKASDDVCFDDSIEPDEPTEVWICLPFARVRIDIFFPVVDIGQTKIRWWNYAQEEKFQEDSSSTSCSTKKHVQWNGFALEDLRNDGKT